MPAKIKHNIGKYRGPGLYGDAVQNRILRRGDLKKNRTLRRQQKMFLFLIGLPPGIPPYGIPPSKPVIIFK